MSISSDEIQQLMSDSQALYDQLDEENQQFSSLQPNEEDPTGDQILAEADAELERLGLNNLLDDEDVNEVVDNTPPEDVEVAAEVVDTLTPEDFRAGYKAIVKSEETGQGIVRTLSNSFGTTEKGSVFDGTTHKAFIDTKDVVNKDLPTIGYGHKMSREEFESGMITIDGEEYSWENGLSDATASSLKDQDWETKKAAVGVKYNKKVKSEYKTKYKTFDDLPEEYQDILTEVAFNIGETKLSKWSKIYKAMNTDDVPEIIDNIFRVIGSYGKTNPHKRVTNLQQYLKDNLKE